MATSVYFSGAVKSEQDLYEDLVTESIKIFGQDVGLLHQFYALRAIQT